LAGLLAKSGMSELPNGKLQLVLASRSPRRHELLREAGFDFLIDPADVDEDDYSPDLLPADLAIRLARTKSHAIAMKRPSDVVLGADTVVAFGDRVLGKPADEDHARRMLRLLSGTTHIVITGVSVTRRSVVFAQEQRVMSAVQMRQMSHAEIDRYVETGLWRGKAGGYGIQDNDPFVKRLAGCYSNIVGLPMKTTAAILAAAGVVPTTSADNKK
jgi:septum formation protein